MGLCLQLIFVQFAWFLPFFLLFDLLMKSSSLLNLYIIIFFAPDQFWFGPGEIHFHWVALKMAEDDDERQFNLV